MPTPEYDASAIRLLTLRESVLARPGMYFGTAERSEWPLTMLAWTVQDLAQRCPPGGGRIVAKVLTDGAFQVLSPEAPVTWPTTRTAEKNIEARLWWRELCRSSRITMETLDAVQPTADGGLSTTAHVSVDMEPDPELLECTAAAWWTDWQDLLPDRLRRCGSPPGPGLAVRAVDVRTGVVCEVG